MKTWEIVVASVAVGVVALIVIAGLAVLGLVWLRNKRAATAAAAAAAAGAAGAPAPAAPIAAGAPAPVARARAAAAGGASAPPPAVASRPHGGWAIVILAIALLLLGGAIGLGADWGTLTMGVKWLEERPVAVLIVIIAAIALILVFAGKSKQTWFKALGVLVLGLIILASVTHGLPWSTTTAAAVAEPQVRWLTPPDARSPTERWAKLNQPGNSKSEFITLPHDAKGIKVEGDGHRLEMVMGTDGAVRGYYIYNDDPVFRTFAYAFKF